MNERTQFQQALMDATRETVATDPIKYLAAKAMLLLSELGLEVKNIRNLRGRVEGSVQVKWELPTTVHGTETVSTFSVSLRFLTLSPAARKARILFTEDIKRCTASQKAIIRAFNRMGYRVQVSTFSGGTSTDKRWLDQVIEVVLAEEESYVALLEVARRSL